MVNFPNTDPLSIALTLWNIGLVSETALMAWADAMILDRAQPSPDLLELAASGAKLCLQRETIESRPLTLTFVEEFCLRSHLLDLSCHRSAIQFIDWVSRNCMGEDLEHSAVLFAYKLDHLYSELDDLSAAIELLRSELPLLLPSCETVASAFLDRVPDLMLIAPTGDANEGQSEPISEIDRMSIDLTSNLPQLVPQQSTQIPLQPLRIPAGWHVAYNNGLFEIDPLPELFPDENPWWIFKEDMLQMYNERFNRMLDLGWYPEGDLIAGGYGLVVYEGDFRGRLLHEFRTRDRLELVAEIERLLSEICQEKL
jgi:hypothetical protein